MLTDDNHILTKYRCESYVRDAHCLTIGKTKVSYLHGYIDDLLKYGLLQEYYKRNQPWYELTDVGRIRAIGVIKSLLPESVLQHGEGGTWTFYDNTTLQATPTLRQIVSVENAVADANTSAEIESATENLCRIDTEHAVSGCHLEMETLRNTLLPNGFNPQEQNSWVSAKEYGDRKGYETDSLKTYRSSGKKNQDGRFGRDARGNIWVKHSNGHVFYHDPKP